MPQNKKKKTGVARYVMHIPTHDTIGNELLDFSPVISDRLQQSLRRMVHSVHVEGPYSHGTHGARHLHLVAQDTPEVDSHVKAMATELGRDVNHPHITVIKEGEQGIQPWTMQNKWFSGAPTSLTVLHLPPMPIPVPGPSPLPHVSPSGVLSSPKARRWLDGDRSLPKL
jgi:hypothetical protein